MIVGFGLVVRVSISVGLMGLGLTVGLGMDVGMDVGRQDGDAISVLVYVAQPARHAVWQGRYDVAVSVLGQYLLGPGIVVVLCGRVSRLRRMRRVVCT